MNISRLEQRALHVLALGGRILHGRDRGGAKVTQVLCVTREGMILDGFDLATFQRLRRKRLIESQAGAPYRISRLGRRSVQAQADNQGG